MREVYVVVFYTDYKKENEWRVQCVFNERKNALEYAEKMSDPENECSEDPYVWPNPDQEIIYQRPCLYEGPEKHVYKKMSWNPIVAVVKTTFNE